MGSLYIDGDQWQIVGPTEAGPQFYGTGGEIARWISDDQGKTWKKIAVLTSGSIRNHSYARRPLYAQEDFYSFWADGNSDKFSESRLYFCDKKSNKVWILPYDMETEFQKPVEVKRSK